MSKPTLDNSRYMMPTWFISTLEGKLLTLADASFSDKDQRKAFKDMIKEQLSFLYTTKEYLPTGLVESLISFEYKYNKDLEQSIPVQAGKLYFPDGEYKIEFKEKN